MDYEEFTRNIRKAGLTLKEFAHLIKTNPNSITNLSKKEQIPKNLAIIAALLGELVDKGLGYEHLFEKMDLEPHRARVLGSFGKLKSKNMTI